MSTEHVAPYLAMEGVCPNPIFVIGSPRSGTTALAQSLNRHPDLRVGKESYILHDLFTDRRAERSWERHTNRVTPSWLAHEEVDLDELLAFLGLGLNALFSSRSDGKRWIDQTPIYTPMVETVAALFPAASFVHIVRDGRQVVRSMSNFERKFDRSTLEAAQPKEIPTWSADFGKGCDTWARWVDAALDFGESHGDRCLTVRNEDLAADPTAGFERVLAFLGARDHPGPGNFFGKQRINSSWVRDPSRPDDDDGGDWDRRRRRKFVDIAGDTMVRAGYGDRRSLEEWSRG